ncbi:MAG TPA: VWA domain-containing protein [Bryobacteraceae bacterium]|nr:VWA domain-containing protein [Bryobacteraceae bacterium]
MKARYALCILSICLAPGFAQPSRAAAPYSSSRSLTLDVTVLDKAGKPVSGLQQSDFTLLDNKRKTPILSFQAVNGVSSGPPVEVVLVIDEINTPFLRVARIRDALGKLFSQDNGKLTNPTSVVLVTDSGAEHRTPPIQDGAALLADVNAADFGLRIFKKSELGFYGAEDQQQISIQSFTQVLDYESSRPGRKLIVWISPGWPLFPAAAAILSEKELQGLFDAVVTYTGQLQRAEITLDEVDPSGAQENEVRLSDFEQYFHGVKGPNQVGFGDVGLQALAYRSGGRVSVGDNDIASQLATCIGDANSYYRIGMERLPGDGPNELHTLDLKVDKPRLTVRTQAAYYAQPAGR